MTNTPSPKHVFMSYSRRDEAVMRRVAEFLRQQGINVWVDNEKLVPGTPIWEEQIEKSIINAAAVVVLLSPDSKNSSWVRREISLAEQFNKRIFPLMIAGDEDSSISLRLITSQYVDIRENEERGLNALKVALSSYLEKMKAQEKVEREAAKGSGNLKPESEKAKHTFTEKTSQQKRIRFSTRIQQLKSLGNGWKAFGVVISLAVLLLIIYWVKIANTNPDIEQFYNLPIPVEVIGLDSGFTIVGEVPKQTNLTLRAHHSIWEMLKENNNIRATLDLSGLRNGEHELDIQIEVPIQSISIVSVIPKTATINLEPLVTRTEPVELSIIGEPAIGYLAGKPDLEPNEIVISGPQSQVARVIQIRADVDLGNISSSFDQKITVQALDENGRVITGLKFDPEDISVSMPVNQLDSYRDLAVKVVVSGQVASGYRLANITVFPPVVTAFSGDPALINSLPGVLETQPLDLEETSDDLTTRLAINLPEGVSLVGDQTVMVRVNVNPIQSSLMLSNQRIKVIGLPEGWFVQIAPDNVDIIIYGPLPVLETLAQQEVPVVINATGLSEGTHVLTPDVEILDPEIRVESINPSSVEFMLSATHIPTPIPTSTLKGVD